MGVSPLHLCAKERNFFAIEVMLKMLTNHPFYQHSQVIYEVLPSIIQMELPQLRIYLESRLIQTPLLAEYKRGGLKMLKQNKHYAIFNFNIWETTSDFQN